MPALQDLVSRIDISDILPQKGDNLLDEIKCYSLPYGVMGFVSHVLTYYVILCLWFARSPLWPFRKANCSKLDLFLGFAGLSLSVGLSTFSIVKCKNTWQLLVIAVWKMSMSLLNGFTAVHAAWAVFVDRNKGQPKTGKSAWWVLLYIPGMLAGMGGLMSLVVQHPENKGVRKLTICFYCIVGGAIIILTFIGMWRSVYDQPRYRNVRGYTQEVNGDATVALKWGIGGFGVSVILFAVLAAFYSDWALGMLTHNLIGLPSGDSAALYWSYFVAKRLPMFSW